MIGSNSAALAPLLPGGETRALDAIPGPEKRSRWMRNWFLSSGREKNFGCASMLSQPPPRTTSAADWHCGVHHQRVRASRPSEFAPVSMILCAWKQALRRRQRGELSEASSRDRLDGDANRLTDVGPPLAPVAEIAERGPLSPLSVSKRNMTRTLSCERSRGHLTMHKR